MKRSKNVQDFLEQLQTMDPEDLAIINKFIDFKTKDPYKWQQTDIIAQKLLDMYGADGLIVERRILPTPPIVRKRLHLERK